MLELCRAQSLGSHSGNPSSLRAGASAVGVGSNVEACLVSKHGTLLKSHRRPLCLLTLSTASRRVIPCGRTWGPKILPLGLWWHLWGKGDTSNSARLPCQEDLTYTNTRAILVLMAKTDYYSGRSSVTAPLRDRLEEPALSLSKGPALGSVSHSVSFVAHFALLVSHSASFTSRAVSKAKAE